MFQWIARFEMGINERAIKTIDAVEVMTQFLIVLEPLLGDILNKLNLLVLILALKLIKILILAIKY